MWIIALLMFYGESYKVTSNQMIYQSYNRCEIERIEVTNRLTMIAPEGGVVLSRCVDMVRKSV